MKKKVPIMIQMEALECGAASLAMICAYHGKWLTLEQVRSDCGVSRDGAKAKNILLAARSYGFDAQGFRYEPEQLKEKALFPCIIHWNFNHFVVLCGFKGKYALINDPARGELCVPMEMFDNSFTGVCLFFEPTEKFEPGGKRASVIDFARKRLEGTGGMFAFIITLSLITFAAGLLSPTFSRVFMDVILPGKNPDLLAPFMGLFAASILLLLLIEYARSVYMRKIEGKLAVVANASFFWHVLRLPMAFFSQRQAGDLAVRQQTNEGIASALMQKLAPVALDFVIVVFYLVLMMRYNVYLTIIGLAAMVVNVWVSRFVARRVMNINRVRMRDMGRKAAATAAGVTMIETLKASGAEDGFFEKWAGYQAAVNEGEVAAAKTSFYWGSLPELVAQLCNIAVLATGVYFCMTGDMTVGLLFAFQAYMTAFSAPAQNLIMAGNTLTDMRAQMERVEDVMTYKPDVTAKTEDGGDYDKLAGGLELNGVTFGYSPLEPPLIRDFSLKIEPGQRIALVGASGCGKSTVSKLISGLYEPWGGTIFYDGKPRSGINRNVFTSSVAVVDQEVTLFNDTIAANIKMWDDSIEDFEVIMAVRDSDMHVAVMERDGGYNYKMSEGGRDFSGGQRQRLEIARALAADPTIVILDEATSALDAKTEFNVVENIKKRGVTCIVIAHRLSTIRGCDEILVMDKGVVVERGTHDELMAKGGKYTELVASE